MSALEVILEMFFSFEPKKILLSKLIATVSWHNVLHLVLVKKKHQLEIFVISKKVLNFF